MEERMPTQDDDPPNLLQLTAKITGAFVTHNPVQANDLTSLLRSVHEALAGLARPPSPVIDHEPMPQTPAAIRKSQGQDYLVSFEDGRRYKVLTRHLTRLGLTPAQYRAKWGLPPDYPMSAPSYSADRARNARRIGLGRVGRWAKRK